MAAIAGILPRVRGCRRETLTRVVTAMRDAMARLAPLEGGIAVAYDALVDKIREKNSECRLQALSEPPVTADIGIEIGKPYIFDDKKERADCIRLMRKGLRISRNLS